MKLALRELNIQNSFVFILPPFLREFSGKIFNKKVCHYYKECHEIDLLDRLCFIANSFLRIVHHKNIITQS